MAKLKNSAFGCKFPSLLGGVAEAFVCLGLDPSVPVPPLGKFHIYSGTPPFAGVALRNAGKQERIRFLATRVHAATAAVALLWGGQPLRDHVVDRAEAVRDV